MIENSFGIKKDSIDYKERIGAYAIIVNKDKLATVKTSKGNFLIGGKKEDNESLSGCIERETLEETGYKSQVKEQICKSTTYTYSDTLNTHLQVISHYYFAKLKNKISKPLEIDHKLEWITIDEIDAKMFLEHQKWAIKYAMDIK